MSQELSIEQIIVDDAVQPRVRGIDLAHVRTLEETPGEWPPLVCVLFDDQYWLVDGRHRLEAACRLGLESVSVDVVQRPADGDLTGLSFDLNVRHGRPLTLDDRRNRAAHLLAVSPNSSDREVARRCALSPATVGKVRARIEAGVQSEQSAPTVQSAPVAIPQRQAGALPGPGIGELIGDGVLSIFSPEQQRNERKIVRYLQHLDVALNDQYEIPGWEKAAQALPACVGMLGQDETLRLAKDLGPALLDILDAVEAMGFDPNASDEGS